jgi:NAD-reducing hydrogenase small subunit
MEKVKIGTCWLDGCSGCHMSLLDMDQRIIDVARRAEIVYSPLVDQKEFPRDVDVCLVEGAVSTENDRTKLLMVRERSKVVVALGDCAVTGNIPAMRNPFGAQAVLQRAYLENAEVKPEIPRDHVPALLEPARPIHEVVNVDIHVPGCPPPAEAILETVLALLEGRPSQAANLTRFGR